MDFSRSEQLVMEMLWEGKCLDENGEIQAVELSRLLTKKYGWQKSSSYTFFARLLGKGAITRRYPKYTLKPVIGREEALKDKKAEVIRDLFQGSVINLFSAFLSEKKVTPEELDEMKALIRDFEKQDR